MKLPNGLAFALMFILIFFMLFKMEALLLSSYGSEKQALVNAFQLTERMRNEANFEFQLQACFDAFREQLYQNPDACLVEGYKAPSLQKLPPHILGLAICSRNGRVEKFVNIKGQMSEAFARNFVEIDYLVSAEQQDVFLGASYTALLADTQKLLDELLGCSADKIGFKQLRASRLSMFESVSGTIGLYWDKQSLKDGKTAYFFSRLELDLLKEALPLRFFLVENQKPGIHCAFFDIRRNRFIADRNFSGLRELPAFSAVYNVCREMSGYRKVQARNIGVINSGLLSGIVGRPMFGNDILPVAIVSNAKINQAKVFSGTGGIVFLSFAALALFIFIQTFCLGRGLRLTVGRVLMLACLAAIFMPFMMGQSVFRMILGEASESGRLKLERDLHNLVSGVDSGARLFHANMLQYFRFLVAKDSSLSALQEEERRDIATQNHISPGDTTEESLVAPEKIDALDFSLVNRLAVEVFTPFLKGLNLEDDVHRKANAVVIMGPEGFTRFYDRFKSFTFTTGKLPDADPIFLILSLFRRTAEPFFPVSEFVPGLLNKEKAGKKAELEQFKFEEIRKHVAASVGPEKVYTMLVNFEGLNNFRTSMGLVNFVVFPLRVDKLIRYFIGISWDEYAISRVYLARVFASLNNSREHLLKARTSLFDLLDPITYIPRTPAFIQAYGNLRNEMLFSGESESARMGMLLKAGMRSRRTVKLKVDGDEEAIYYVLPGRFFTLYVVGGIQPTTFLKKIEEWRALILLLGTVFFTVCAAVAAQNVSRSVSSPLEHLLWGLSMIERSDFNVRLRDTREDEFGSISRAFNLMARRLRERDMLGKFVSPEVRRLAGDHELFQAARQGSEADVTILFAALEGFDEYAVTAPVEKVQALLENTLEQFYRLAGETGGEVDKIIGGKLLIVFSHSRVGSKQAAASAVDLASRILKIFKDDARVRLVFGINSGRVISGIIGAPAVRMDNTVIGDPVNVAARLCSLADSQKMPVVVSEQIVAALDGRYPASRVEIRSIRGKKQEVEVFNLLINEAD